MKGKDVSIEWMPFELRPWPNETLEPSGDYLQRAWSENVLPTAEQFGVKMVLPNVSPQPHTHLAFEGFQFAKEQGKGSAYNHRMFTAFFQESQDIGDVEVLTKLAGEIGLDTAEFRRALEERRYKEAHQAALRHAYDEAKINVVPTFIIGERVMRGLYTQQGLERVIEEEIRNQSHLIPPGLVCDADGCD